MASECTKNGERLVGFALQHDLTYSHETNRHWGHVLVGGGCRVVNGPPSVGIYITQNNQSNIYEGGTRGGFFQDILKPTTAECTLYELETLRVHPFTLIKGYIFE